MNKLVFGALALTLTSTAGFASDNEWLSLDQEIDALASSLTVQGGAGISGWIGANYFQNSDTDTGDFQSMARLNVAGSVGDYGYKISLDSGALIGGSGGGLGILDAYVTFPCGDAISTTFGQFKSPYSRSGLLSGNRLLFQNRTTIGAVAATRSEGIMLNGSFDALNWAVAAQDGADGAADEYQTTIRATFDIMGDGVGDVEGAYGAGDGMNATIALALYDDGNGGGPGVGADSTNIGFDMTGGAWSLSASMDTLGVDGAPDDVENTCITGSYMLTPDTWELAVRMDSTEGTTLGDVDVTSFGVNKYVSGHDLKWSINMVNAEATGSADVDTLSVGVLVSF